ncbi:uncharacterized protein Z520_11753 [Fonsecaea multimorphosa CBS 102226]|uniref:F-box domain-containing protein n=1 Tax=Fonsecaea multimorphosa CBS 102226 TaxID=1442371 RepID=A0A0D2JHC1_9EURO|nr:uncharacterized protein Z520_11753 [Fonsecaea multimorphosa CBS 102226]KIX92577.1 hypothetical protein Z520_11753 [Fonsecaea multimorphosa CBS 102226]OAL17839.1 hypothetical protein AYO22_11266 [Fonsecaea multimorphosa]
MPPGGLWKPFIISQNVLTSPDNQSSPLFRLPHELLLEIFRLCRLPDQIAFAITCKHLLHVSTIVSLKVSRRECPDLQTMEKLLKVVRPLNKAGRVKKTWLNCLDCLRWRPRKKSYWTKKLQHLPFRDEMRATWMPWLDENSDNRVLRWNENYSLQCPECWYHEQVEKMLEFVRARKRWPEFEIPSAEVLEEKMCSWITSQHRYGVESSGLVRRRP